MTRLEKLEYMAALEERLINEKQFKNKEKA